METATFSQGLLCLPVGELVCVCGIVWRADWTRFWTRRWTFCSHGLSHFISLSNCLPHLTKDLVQVPRRAQSLLTVWRSLRGEMNNDGSGTQEPGTGARRPTASQRTASYSPGRAPSSQKGSTVRTTEQLQRPEGSFIPMPGWQTHLFSSSLAARPWQGKMSPRFTARGT